MMLRYSFVLVLLFIVRVVWSCGTLLDLRRVMLIDALADSTVSQIRGIPGITDVHVIDSSERGDENLIQRRITEFKPHALVVRSSRISAAMMDGGLPHLDLILRAGAGYNNIDVAHAPASVAVCNTPGCNAIAVAELTLGLIIAADRKIVDSTLAIKEGKWEKQRLSIGQVGLFGSTIGIIGAGHIGKAVIQRALSFGMNVIVWSRRLESLAGKPISQFKAKEVLDVDYIPPGTSVAIAASPLDVAASGCDFFSVHVSTPEPLIDADVLNALSPGCLVINTARSSVLDNDELARQVKDPSRRLRIALDVYHDEPMQDGRFPTEGHNELVREKNFIGTHHMGASTAQAQAQVAQEVIKTLQSWCAGLGYKHRVN